MSRWERLGLALVIAGLVGAHAAPAAPRAQADPDAGAFELSSGVFVDTERGWAFITRPDLRLQCIDLATGRSRWLSKEAARALHLGDERLLAQVAPPDPERGGNALELAVLDVESGERVHQIRVPLTGGARSLLQPRVDVHFDLGVEPVGDATGKRVRLDWRYRRVRGSGTRYASRSEPLDLRGAVEIDLASGESSPAAPPDAEGTSAADREPPVASAPWGRARRAGNVYATVGSENGRFGRFVVRRWDAQSGARLPDIPLEGARSFRIAARGPHLITSRPVSASRFLWTVRSLETGEPLGEVEADRISGAFVLWKAQLVYESRAARRKGADGTVTEDPRALVGVSLADGRRLWSHPLRASGVAGSLPPS